MPSATIPPADLLTETPAADDAETIGCLIAACQALGYDAAQILALVRVFRRAREFLSPEGAKNYYLGKW